MYYGAPFHSQFFPSGPMNHQQVFDPSRHYPSPPSTPPLPLRRQPTNLELCAPHMVEEKVLGTGAYGTVYLARDTTTGIKYAVKALNKFIDGRPVDYRTQQFQQTEMNLHYQASAHPNVVSLLRILDSPLVTYVFLEYCPEGDLFTNITEYQRYTSKPQDAKAVFLQILDAVAHCHSLGIYHRDLKPENILVSSGGSQVKLADFGLATTEPYSRDFGCGSTFYMSPECHDTSASKPFYACGPNDIWSLGVILVNLTCGRNPWKVASTKKDSTYRAFRANEDFLKDILPLSVELNEILKMIFTKDPAQRITLPELRARVEACSFNNSDPLATLPLPTQQFPVLPQDYSFAAQAPVYQDTFCQARNQYPEDVCSKDISDIDSGYGSPEPVFSNMSQGSSNHSMQSMESDHSDNSSIASEAGSPRDFNSNTVQPQIVKSPSFGCAIEDSQPYQPSNFSKLYDFANVCNFSHMVPARY